MLEREIELALLAVDFRDAHVGLRIFRIRVRDHFVLFESGIGLAIVQQVLRQAANRVQIVAIHFNRVPIRLNGVLILLLLLVGVTERRIKLSRALRRSAPN